MLLSIVDHSREHPPAGTGWQLNYARKVMFYARHHPDDEGEATVFTPVDFEIRSRCVYRKLHPSC
jgi:hypothetical protein